MHLTYSEIKDQYKALKKTINAVEDRLSDVRGLFDRVKPTSLVFFGCGSSYNLAESLAVAAQVYLKLPATALAAGDYMLHSGGYDGFLGNTLAVVLSRSGSTSEVLAAVERLKAATGAHVLSICAVEESKLARLSDVTLEMPWCFDSSVCQTRTVSCLYLAGMMLIARLSGNAGLAAGLMRAVDGAPSYMTWWEEELKFIASKAWTNAVVLSDAELAGIGGEAALAFQEICQRSGVHHHVLDVRHGPMVLIGRGTLVIAALTDGNAYERALVADIAQKGAELIIYTDTPMDGLPEKAVNISFGEGLPHAARGLPLIVIAQLIAYWRAVADGVDPDRPQGLDPWIKL